MSTATKTTLQVKTVLSGKPKRVWDGFTKRHAGAGNSSLMRMLLLEYDRLLEEINQKGRDATIKRTSKENADLIENWQEKGSKANLTRLEEEEAMSDWWMKNKKELRG